MSRYFLLSFLLILTSQTGYANPRTKALYNSLDPLSISQHLALYELYPNSQEGQNALNDAWNLLSNNSIQHSSSLPLNYSLTNALIALVNKQPNQDPPELSEPELQVMERLGQRLANRRLKGSQAKSEEEVLALPPREIDLARGLFLSEPSPHDWIRIHRYEYMLDLMALQVLARLPKNASPKEKVKALNHFVFKDLQYRFPPHSLYAKDIDLYTFLPSVLDSRKGVCLGVSILYLCIAQRIDLPLEVITPPGHIYIRYRDGDEVLNIETTAFGIHIDSEEYLSVGTRKLQLRTIKEVIGMAHVNHSSIYLQNKEFQEGLEAYQRAIKYMPDDMLIHELMGYSFLFLGKEDEGKKYLQMVIQDIPDHSVNRDTMAEDYLLGKTDAEGILAVFEHVDETRESILEKKKKLEQVVKKYPQFRNGIFGMAVTWLQLHREAEALEWLKRYHQLEPNDPNAEYYLAAVYAQRMNYPRAWQHLKNAERIVAERDHDPKALKALRRELCTRCPE